MKKYQEKPIQRRLNQISFQALFLVLIFHIGRIHFRYSKRFCEFHQTLHFEN